MGTASQMLGSTYEDGRSEQYRQMMAALAQLQGKYKGVRGELLAKVKAELEKTAPTKPSLRMVTPPPAKPAPCRACGREMRPSGTDGTLVCQNGHSRIL